MSVQPPRRLPLTVLRLALAGAATTGMFALVGCTGSSDTTGSSAPASAGQTSSSTGSSSSAPSSSAPSSEPSAETSSESSDSSSDSGNAGRGTDSADKPTKQEVQKGLTKFYETSQKMSPDKAKAFAKCMTNQLYGHVSNDMLIMMRDGKPDPAKATSSDKTKLGKAGLKCQPVL